MSSALVKKLAFFNAQEVDSDTTVVTKKMLACSARVNLVVGQINSGDREIMDIVLTSSQVVSRRE